MLKSSIHIIFIFLSLNFLSAQESIDKHTILCDHSYSGEEIERQLVNGFVTGWVEPYVVDVATSDPYHFIYMTDYTDIDEIILDHAFMAQHTLNGVAIATLSLLDDGLGNDEVAGDNIFTSADVVYSNPNNYQFAAAAFLRFTNVTYNYSNGTSETLSVDLGFGARYVNSNSMNTNIPVAVLGPDVQYSSHVVNIAVDLVGQYAFTSLWDRSQIYYDYFPDTKDVLMFATNYATPGSPAASYSSIQREATGVVYNGTTFDNSSTYGSDGELNGIMRYFYTHGGAASLTNHELMHQYGTSLHPDLDLTISGSHWSIVEYQNSGFGSGYQRPIINDEGGGCYTTSNSGYTSEYNEMEMYLMGLSSIDDINWPIKTLADWTFTGLPNCTFTSTTGIVEIEKADYEALMPPRIPDYTTAKKDFEGALIVLTNRLMTPEEMSYYNWQMEQNEMLIGDSNRVTAWSSFNFNEATNGLGTYKTKLPCPLNSSPDNLVITDNPIPSGTYEAINSLTANTPVVNNGDLYFKAGQIVNLDEGFEVTSLTEFLAEIMGCGM